MQYFSIPKKAGIYMLICLLNGKIYIGKANNLFRRIKEHFFLSSDQVIDRAIKKYGKENFTIFIIDEFETIDNIELLALEVAYIEYFDSTNPKIGYNICKFSFDRSGLKHSEETKQKMSKNSTRANLGKRFSEEHRQQISYTRIMKGVAKGKNNPNWGNRGSKNPINKKVKQISKNTGEIIKIWNSVVEATKELNINKNGISNACNMWQKTSGGFKWEYAEKENNVQPN